MTAVANINFLRRARDAFAIIQPSSPAMKILRASDVTRECWLAALIEVVLASVECLSLLYVLVLLFKVAAFIANIFYWLGLPVRMLLAIFG